MAVLLHSSSFSPVERQRRRRGGRRISATAAPDPLTAAARLLWGRSLPPQTLVAAVRTGWSAAWHLMMRQLAPPGPSGSYSRPPSAFPSVPDDYFIYSSSQSAPLHLYVGLPCPWAHRTLIVRALRSLETLIPVSVASPGADGSWEFGGDRDHGAGDRDLGPGIDRCGGMRTVREVYKSQIGGYDGRSTVPMLWDSSKRTVVCNESYGIIEFLNSIPNGGPDLCPPHLKEKIERWNQIIYPNLNNGVYRCGFSQSQEAYDSASEKLFETLDLLEGHLAESRYLCGDALTLADVCLFTTLVRFDLVYNGLFRCTKKKLIEYPNLYGYTRDIYQMEGGR
ncbi:glutathione S-transferase family protein isoform X2 [Wolffia australiana]